MNLGYLAIGNGEPCPICKQMQTPNDAGTTFKHIAKEHPKELEKMLFPKSEKDKL